MIILLGNSFLRKNSCLLNIIFSFSCWVHFSANAVVEPLQVSIPNMPKHAEENQKGVLIDFVKVLATKLERDIDIQIVPFSRSIYYVSTNKVDFHLPFIKPLAASTKLTPQNTANELTLKQHAHDFIYSDATIFEVNFVLYRHKEVAIEHSKIINYKIETDSAHLSFMDDLLLGSNCITCSLKKVQHKMTDGYIFADSATDPVLLENKDLLSEIKREFYQKFDVKILFPNTKEGQQLNKKLSAIIADMRLSGELDELLSPVDFEYDDWQL